MFHVMQRSLLQWFNRSEVKDDSAAWPLSLISSSNVVPKHDSCFWGDLL